MGLPESMICKNHRFVLDEIEQEQNKIYKRTFCPSCGQFKTIEFNKKEYAWWDKPPANQKLCQSK